MKRGPPWVALRRCPRGTRIRCRPKNRRCTRCLGARTATSRLPAAPPWRDLQGQLLVGNIARKTRKSQWPERSPAVGGFCWARPTTRVSFSIFPISAVSPIFNHKPGGRGSHGMMSTTTQACLSQRTSMSPTSRPEAWCGVNDCVASLQDAQILLAVSWEHIGVCFCLWTCFCFVAWNVGAAC